MSVGGSTCIRRLGGSDLGDGTIGAHVLALVLATLSTAGCASHGTSLQSWNDGPAKSAIIAFVERVTDPGSPDFVPVSERIAVFDNDGTLWCEQPAYVQVQFTIDRLNVLAPAHPEWRSTQPFQAVLEDKLRALATISEKDALELVMATHAGMTSEEFALVVREWLANARHPKTGLPYTALAYQPMLELLAYLRASGFKTFIVSGGGMDFMRTFAEDVYGVPPEQVIGSRIKAAYESDPSPLIRKIAGMEFLDDKDGKPVGIHQHVGRRPIAAFGNSDGDFEMLEWTTTGGGRRLGVLIHHDDAVREVAYDRDSHVGRLARGLDEAARRGWLVVSMKDDWRSVFRAAPVEGPAEHAPSRAHPAASSSGR